MLIVFDIERTNQLSLLPDKDLVDLCPPIEPYQVTKNPIRTVQFIRNKALRLWMDAKQEDKVDKYSLNKYCSRQTVQVCRYCKFYC
ncbi:hypothetical protein MAN88_30200 [Microcystis aeruginosa]|nr:hypothetical protein MAN88_30200 [Microcystis aeruginosa]